MFLLLLSVNISNHKRFEKDGKIRKTDENAMLAVIHFLSLVLSYGFTVLQMLSELISNDIRIYFDISFDLFYFNHFL